MTRTYGWSSQLAVGARGQDAVASYLRGRGYSVEDVSEDRDFQSQDIDLRVRGQRKQRWKTIEVKTDSYRSGNVFLELRSSAGKPGCVFKSRAQWWAYWLSSLGILLLIDLPELQLWLLEHGAEYERMHVGSSRGKGRWSVEGIAVPWARLVEDGVAGKVTLEDEENHEESIRGEAAA